MHLSRRILIQLGVFIVVAIIAISVMLIGYIKAPALFFGAGQYTVTVQLPAAGGLYETANVTYRGTEVGRVRSVHLTDSGMVEAVLTLEDGIPIPSDLDAEVHSTSAVGEQYVALLPRDDSAPALADGDVIPLERTTVPPDINALLDSTSRGLEAIPQDQLQTVIDESYTAFGGLGADISRLVRGSTSLAIDARAELDPLLTLIDGAKPVLDSQTESGNSVRAWASSLASATESLRDHDAAVAGVITNAGPAAEEARALFDRLQPTLPVLLANLVSLNEVAITYQPAIEQLLVLLPIGIGNLQGIGLPGRDTKQSYNGQLLSFNLNLNLPPVCNTGFLPATQIRSPSEVDAPPRPPGDVYCRIPQDAPYNVRGARNYPCLTVPGKRAPTVAMCESDEQYMPLNDGYAWKGDPNATLSGQNVPQVAPDQFDPNAPVAALEPPPPAAVPIAIADYDPATGSYVGPDGRVYTQSDLALNSGQEQTWQDLLITPGN
jgi:phospholipid/cholesterol/gamma-HCH transport system substrate-binding protein